MRFIQKKLLPKPADLSYFNWETQTCTSNPTPNFQVIADSEAGLLFKNKRDRKTINVDPNVLCFVQYSYLFSVCEIEVLRGLVYVWQAYCGDNSTRHEIKDEDYIQIVIYDHQTRRKT